MQWQSSAHFLARAVTRLCHGIHAGNICHRRRARAIAGHVRVAHQAGRASECFAAVVQSPERLGHLRLADSQLQGWRRNGHQRVGRQGQPRIQSRGHPGGRQRALPARRKIQAHRHRPAARVARQPGRPGDRGRHPATGQLRPDAAAIRVDQGRLEAARRLFNPRNRGAQSRQSDRRQPEVQVGTG